jgi:uncharacterized LabA/DUF88 family protein
MPAPDLKRPVANIYVDGYNLYYGALRNSPFKWLDLRTLSQLLLPDFEIGTISYFTARVKERPDDLQAPVRQQTYLSVLSSIPPVEIHFGHFLQSTVRMRVADPLAKPRTVEVLKTEEKGSDVNLATHLMLDAFQEKADIFVVLSNDSDLTEPLKIVRETLGKMTGIINPHRRQSRALLSCNPTIVRQIRDGALGASQFPDRVVLPNGRAVQKPAEWS